MHSRREEIAEALVAGIELIAIAVAVADPHINCKARDYRHEKRPSPEEFWTGGSAVKFGSILMKVRIKQLHIPTDDARSNDPRHDSGGQIGLMTSFPVHDFRCLASIAQGF